MEDHKAPLISLSNPEEDEEYKPQLTFGV